MAVYNGLEQRHFQFRLRTLYAATVILPIVIALLWTLFITYTDELRELGFWIVVFVGALAVRMPASNCCEKMGLLIRHSMGWIAATTGATFSIFVTYAVETPRDTFGAFLNGLGIACFAAGLGVGCLIEFGCFSFRICGRVARH